MDTQKSGFEELLACLTARSVRFVVVGGHALAYHGHPRFTKDLDVLVEPSPGNAKKLVLALGDFGFGSAGLTVGDFSTAGRIVQLGVAPNRVDLITAIDGVSFDEAWDSRVSGRFGSLQVPFLGREAFLRNKRASGRAQVLADIEAIEGR